MFKFKQRVVLAVELSIYKDGDHNNNNKQLVARRATNSDETGRMSILI